MPRKPSRPAPRKGSRKGSPKAFRRHWIPAEIVTLLIIVYIATPFAILQVLNRNLNKNPQYSNHVGGLVLNPLRGGYTLREFAIRRKLGDSVVPVFTAKTIAVSVDWKSLARGEPRAKAALEAPNLHLVAQFFEARRKKKPGGWQRTFNLFHVFPVDRIAVRDGAIRFHDYSKRPAVNLRLDALEGEVTGLTAARGEDPSPDTASARPSALKARARLMNQAVLRVEANMLPSAARPTMDLRAELKNFELTRLNGAFRAYSGLDVEQGTLSLAARFRAREGRFEGVVHRELQGLKIFDPETDDEGFWKSALEAVVDAAGKLVEKRAEPDRSPDIPVSGSFAAESETWAALGGMLRGAFVRALDPRLGKSLGEDAGLRWDTPEVSKARKLLPP